MSDFEVFKELLRGMAGAESQAEFWIKQAKFMQWCGDNPDKLSAMITSRPSSGGDANRQEPMLPQIPFDAMRTVFWMAFNWNDHNSKVQDLLLACRDIAKSVDVHSFDEANEWLESHANSKRIAPSVATEEQRPVAWVIDAYDGKFITPDEMEMAAWRDKKDCKITALFAHPSPSQDAIMGAAREIVMALNGEGYIQSLSAWTGNHLEQNIAAILLKHLGPVKHDDQGETGGKP